MKKNIVIALLLIIIILMGGTFYYLYTNQDKIFEKCNCPKTKCDEQVTEKKDSVKEQEETNKNSDLIANENGYIDAVYSFTTTENVTTTVVLFSSGKCAFSTSMSYNLCNYDITDNKLNLHFPGSMLFGDGKPYTDTYEIIEHDMMQFIKKTNDTNSIELKRLQ